MAGIVYCQDLERVGCLLPWEEGEEAGLEFCAVLSRVSQEGWVTSSAWCGGDSSLKQATRTCVDVGAGRSCRGDIRKASHLARLFAFRLVRRLCRRRFCAWSSYRH